MLCCSPWNWATHACARTQTWVVTLWSGKNPDRYLQLESKFFWVQRSEISSMHAEKNRNYCKDSMRVQLLAGSYFLIVFLRHHSHTAKCTNLKYTGGKFLCLPHPCGLPQINIKNISITPGNLLTLIPSQPIPISPPEATAVPFFIIIVCFTCSWTSYKLNHTV